MAATSLESLRKRIGEAGFNALVDWAVADPQAAEAELRKVVWGVPARRISRQPSAPLVDARQIELQLK
jgi:hypothetical protein